MDVNTVWKIIQYAANKNQNGGNITPEQFNTVLMPTAQRQYLDLLLGEYQKYQIKRPISAQVEIGNNQRVSTSLSPLIYGAILSVFPYGLAIPPSDFEYVNAMWGLYGHYNIRWVNQDRLDSYYHSEIDPITENPIYLISQEGFQFYPENIAFARLSYVRTPPSIVWGYDEDSNGRPVYNPMKSQQPVWGDSDIYQIIVRALSLVGINLQLNTLVGYANDIKNNGQ